MANTQRDQLLTLVKGLLTSGKYSDLDITCGPDTYHVHKNIVCLRCGFFESAVHFAAGTEAEEGRIDFPEDEPSVIKFLIQFLYEGEYDPKLEAVGSAPSLQAQVWIPYTCNPPPCEEDLCDHHECGFDCNSDCARFICPTCLPATPVGDASQLLLHAKMYEVGDKYDVTGLKELAREKFKRACAVDWCDKQFGVAAEYAFTTTPDEDRGLRDCVRDTLSNHRELITKAGVKEFLQKRPMLMYELLAGNTG